MLRCAAFNGNFAFLRVNQQVARGVLAARSTHGASFSSVKANTTPFKICSVSYSTRAPPHADESLLIRDYGIQRRYYSSSSKDESSVKPAETKMQMMARYNAKAKKVLQHYWLGTKLLWKNIVITTELVQQLIRGKTLSRRERKLLVQTSADLFRLIPFIIILAVPFMELSLPFLLKFFPNLLPSTYQWKDEKEEIRAKRLKANLELAKFLQETMHEMSLDLKRGNVVNAQEFVVFMNKVKREEPVTNEEILRFSQLFQDELTLEKVTREQLLAMEKYLSGSNIFVKQWVSTDFLRTRLGNKIERIKQDDKVILREGLESLSMEEIVDASISRGMKVEGLNRAQITKQLQEWMSLSQLNVPPSLLVLSRAFMLTSKQSAVEALEDTLEHLSEAVTSEVVKELPPDEVASAQEELEKLDKERKLAEQEHSEQERTAKAEEATVDARSPPANETAQGPKEDAEELIEDLDEDIERLAKKQDKIESELDEIPIKDKASITLSHKLDKMIDKLQEEIDSIEAEHDEPAKDEPAKNDESTKKDEALTEDKPKDGETKGKPKADERAV